MTAKEIMTRLESLGSPSIKKVLLQHGVREPFFGVKVALSQNISEYTVPWVAAGSQHGYELALEWIESPKEHIAAAGWSTLANLVSLVADDKLDLAGLKKLVARAVKEIHSAPNRVRYTMNNFVICVGAYVPALSAEGIAAAKKIGT